MPPTFITDFRADPDEIRCGEPFTISVSAQFECAQGNTLKFWVGGDVCELRSDGQAGEVQVNVDAPTITTTIRATLDCPPGTHAVLRLCAKGTDCRAGTSPLRWRPLRVRCP